MGVQIAIADTMATIEATCSDGYPATKLKPGHRAGSRAVYDSYSED